MKRYSIKTIPFFGFLILATLMFNGCIDKDFDTPDPLEMPVGEVYTISELRQMFIENDKQPLKFTEDMSVYGVITMDGSTGNIYKSAFFEDETAAINLRMLSPGGLNQGDSIRIYLKGIVMSEYASMLQLDSVHTGNNITKLRTGIEWQPTQTDILTLLTDTTLIGKLVKLNEVEFHPSDLGSTFADGENLEAQNRILRECNGNEIIVRTSGYASFADDLVPEGNGSIVAIMARFNNDRQLYIRNLSELDMDGPRCSEGNDDDVISIAAIRQMYNDGTTNLPAGAVIKGVITSDAANQNTFNRNAFLQDETGGIALRFLNSHGFNMGDQISISAGSIELSEYQGLLQVNDIPNSNANLLETNVEVEPVIASIADIVSDMDYFEARLVQINDATISGGSTFAGSLTLSDDTGSMVIYTRNDATFSGAAVPTGTITITGVVSVHNTPQFFIRNLDDIQQ